MPVMMYKGIPYGEGTNTLDGLKDVDISNLSDGDVLKYNSSTGKFENGSQFQPFIYSTTEREIGVWIDGKPLYQKTVIGTVSNNPEILFVGKDYDVDEYIHVFGKLKSINSDAEYEFIETGYVNDNNYAGFYNAGETTKNLKLYYNTDSYHYGSTYYVTIQYTKTTDTPGSGTWTPQGVPAHHYSTTEHVVGTWIDGSTVYEKTQYISALPSSVGDWVNYPHGISNFDRLISVSATAYNGNIPQQLNIPHVYATGGTPTMSGQISVSVSDTNIGFIVGQDRSSWEAYVTIRYTKTST